MTTDDTTGTPASPDAQFCPECGQRAEATDRFCRRCGHPLRAVAPEADLPPSQPVPRRRRRTALVAAALLALAGVAAALVIVLGGGLTTDEPDDGAAAQGRLAAERARVKPAFDELMNHRDAFLTEERRYLASMDDARDTIRGYRREKREYDEEFERIDEEFADEFDQCTRFDIPCPDPDYPEFPKVPSFSKHTKALRASSRKLEELRAVLASVQPRPELSVLHTQLLASVDALNEEASHNADVLDEAAEPAEGDDVGTLDKGKLRTLREETALPAIRQLNLAAVGVIDGLRLRKLDYDVPGGRDIDSADHSDEA
jgi:hypothetical protein